MLRAQSLNTTRRSRTEESLIHLYEQLSRARQKFRRLCARECLRSGRQTSTPSNFPRPYVLFATSAVSLPVQAFQASDTKKKTFRNERN